MSEEVKIKISQPMFEVGELERFDNNIHSIVEEYSKMLFKEKDQILTQRIIMKQEEEIERLKEQLNDEIQEELKQSEIMVKKQQEIERLNNIIKELDKQNGELGAELSITKDRIDKTNWWLEQMLKQATNNETKAIISGALELLLGDDKE